MNEIQRLRGAPVLVRNVDGRWKVSVVTGKSSRRSWLGMSSGPSRNTRQRRVPREVSRRIEIELIPQVPAGGPLALTRTPNSDGVIGPRIRSSSIRSSRFTIGQVMVGTAVFASLLAVPRLAVSPDRIVMVCLVGLLTVLALLNMLVEMVFGKPCPSCSRWTLRRLATLATTVARRAGDDSSGSDWAPGLMRPAPKTRYRKRTEAGTWKGFAAPKDLGATTSGRLL